MEETKKSDRYTEHLITSEPREKRRGPTLATRDHDVIRKWAEARGAQPASGAHAPHRGQIGVLRLEFPGHGAQNLTRIGWEEWFHAFDERDLCFVYQEQNAGGKRSNFFRLELSG